MNNCGKSVKELLNNNLKNPLRLKPDILSLLKAVKHEYCEKDIEAAADLINLCLRWIPEERISAKDALKHTFFD